MSRRMTGRYDPKADDPKKQAERRKRSGVIAGSKPAAARTATPPSKPQGVVVEVRDEEKGSMESKNGPAVPTPTTKKWTEKLTSKGQR